MNQDQTAIEMLLSEPEIVAWLEPAADDDRDEDDPPTATWRG